MEETICWEKLNYWKSRIFCNFPTLISRPFEMSKSVANLQSSADKAPKTLVSSLTKVFQKHCQLPLSLRHKEAGCWKTQQNFMVVQFSDFQGPKIWRCGEWPCGLRHYIKNQKVLGSNPTRHLARHRDPTSWWGSQWPSHWNCTNSVLKHRVSEAVPSRMAKVDSGTAK